MAATMCPLIVKQLRGSDIHRKNKQCKLTD